MGVPQGSILSVTLFNLKINSLAKVLSQDVQGSLYVDDFLMSYRANNTKTCERQLQGCLCKIEEWCTENGFKFSLAKTLCFHNKRRAPLSTRDSTRFEAILYVLPLGSLPRG